MRYHTWILILYQIVYFCAIGCILLYIMFMEGMDQVLEKINKI